MLTGPTQGPVLLKLATKGNIVDEDLPDDEDEDVDWTDSVNPSNNLVILSVEWKARIISWHLYTGLASFKKLNYVASA